MARSIEERASFDLIRYANCWEDADVLTAALRPEPGKRILSVASGGDNSFALLAAGAEVVAADLSRAQLALVELKAAAIRQLEYEEALAFLGIRPSGERLATLAALDGELTPEARAYWQAHPQLVADGVVHQGKFESYFRLFRTRVLPLVHRRRTVLELLAPRERAARREFYEQRWDNLRWRLLFRVFFSRFMMGRLGRDPEFFRYVEGSVADRIMDRCRYALTELPTDRNPYLGYILTGNFPTRLPHYLEPGPFHAVKDRREGLTLYHGPIQDAGRAHAGAGFDGFNLSDIFEYLDPATCRDLFGALLEVARPQARLVYWNMLVPRSCPAAFADRVRSLAEEAGELFARDLAFFYSALKVEEVIG